MPDSNLNVNQEQTTTQPEPQPLVPASPSEVPPESPAQPPVPTPPQEASGVIETIGAEVPIVGQPAPEIETTGLDKVFWNDEKPEEIPVNPEPTVASETVQFVPEVPVAAAMAPNIVDQGQASTATVPVATPTEAVPAAINPDIAKATVTKIVDEEPPQNTAGFSEIVENLSDNQQ